MRVVLLLLIILIGAYVSTGLVGATGSVRSAGTRETYQNQPHVRFLGALETAKLVLDDPDCYNSGMTGADLVARGADEWKGRRALRNQVAAAATSFTPPEKDVLERAAWRADVLLKQLPPGAYPGVDGAAAAAVPWLFAITEGLVAENGKAHVRIINEQPVIFFSTIGLTEEIKRGGVKQVMNTLMYFKFETWAAVNRDKVEAGVLDAIQHGAPEDKVRKYEGTALWLAKGSPLDIAAEHVYEKPSLFP